MIKFQFNEIARLADRGDNVAIATRRINHGAIIETQHGQITTHHTILEGHRFVLTPTFWNGDPIS